MDILKSKGIIPGIKVDKGVVPLPDTDGETTTQVGCIADGFCAPLWMSWVVDIFGCLIGGITTVSLYGRWNVSCQRTHLRPPSILRNPHHRINNTAMPPFNWTPTT